MPEQPDQTPEDLIAAMRADGDQMRAGMAELTQIVVGLRQELLVGGFSPDMADGMASAYFGVLLGVIARG